jgi:hypothetical protein
LRELREIADGDRPELPHQPTRLGDELVRVERLDQAGFRPGAPKLSEARPAGAYVRFTWSVRASAVTTRCATGRRLVRWKGILERDSWWS